MSISHESHDKYNTNKLLFLAPLTRSQCDALPWLQYSPRFLNYICITHNINNKWRSSTFRVSVNHLRVAHLSLSLYRPWVFNHKTPDRFIVSSQSQMITMSSSLSTRFRKSDPLPSVIRIIITPETDTFKPRINTTTKRRRINLQPKCYANGTHQSNPLDTLSIDLEWVQGDSGGRTRIFLA